MKFGFDIDDTLIGLREHAFHIYNKNLKKNIAIEVFHELKTVEIHEPFGMSGEEGGEMWKRSLDEIYYTSCPSYPDALEFLQELDSLGHEIYFITARPGEHGDRTKEWMKKQGFPVRDDRFFCGMKDEAKAEIIERLQLDFYFDDKPAILDTLKSDKLKKYVKDQSYNRDAQYPRIKEWSDFREEIKELIKTY